MIKRSLAILLCVMMIASLVPMTASAESNFAYSGDCRINDVGVLVVSGDAVILGGNCEKSILIEKNAGEVKLENVVADKVTIRGGRITANGDATAISANTVEISGGVLCAKGNSGYGIYAENSITVDGGTVTASGNKAAIYCADGKLECSLPVQKGKIYSGANLLDVKISNGTYVIGNSAAIMVWLSKDSPCNHENTEAINAVQATCTEPGYTGDIVCKDCLVTVKEGSTIKAVGHFYSDGKCIRCGKSDGTSEFSDTGNLIKNYREAIAWAVENGVASGYPDGTFRPNNDCTRGHVVTFLWRANGCPEPTTKTNPFKDVSSSSPFYKAILWAAENKITTGYSDGTFRPNAPCTRAHVVTFLWRSEGKPAYTSKAELTDVSGLNKDFTNAIYWAAEEGITTGYYDKTFRPNNVCTRAQVVTFIYRDMT